MLDDLQMMQNLWVGFLCTANTPNDLINKAMEILGRVMLDKPSRVRFFTVTYVSLLE